MSYVVMQLVQSVTADHSKTSIHDWLIVDKFDSELCYWGDRTFSA